MDLSLVAKKLGISWYTPLGNLTDFSRKYLTAWVLGHEKVKRPQWDEYFMSMAVLAATRSHDAQWQVGAVLVKDNYVLGTGYNAFPKDMPDHDIPNTRPLKYPWIIHAEVNALYNSNTADTEGATCYVNSYPCLECMKALKQKGIRNYVVTKGEYAMLKAYTDDAKATYYALCDWGKIDIREMDLSPDTFTRALAILEKTK